MVFYWLLNIIIVLGLAIRILTLDGSKLGKVIISVYSLAMIYFFANEIIKNLNV
ncbi:TPA: hypothetical protein ACF2DJ_002851 [Clostridium perfringens]|uniref:hypothetical protein n=1 Tax=Clostridium perfringens TaxID=1502 RepID=UPI000A832343|nr:hypothetical protein [Clostridium perfringens]